MTIGPMPLCDYRVKRPEEGLYRIPRVDLKYTIVPLR